jgi:formyltetrahydrofolate synthetase
MKIQLTVAYVEFGGNTGGGQYFYSYSPDIIKVTKANETLEFVLSAATDDRFTIDTLVSTDANNQFQNQELKSNKRAIEVLDKNSNSQLTMVAVLVKDAKTGLHISCDPQVLNVPEY